MKNKLPVIGNGLFAGGRSINNLAPRVAVPVMALQYDEEDGYSIAITCLTSGADIYYTTNGDTPTKDSTAYTVPVKFSDLIHLKAIALKTDYRDSIITDKTFTESGEITQEAFLFDANTYELIDEDTYDMTYTAIIPAPEMSNTDNTVTISTIIPGATLVVTTDGSTPVIPAY